MSTNKIALIVICIIVLGCMKSKLSDKQESTTESPIETLIYTKEWSDIFMSQRNSEWTSGLIFYTSKEGKVTELGAKLSKGTYIVALWDSTTQNLLAHTSVTVYDSTKFAYTKIEDIQISPGKPYIVTVNNTPIGLPYHEYWVYYFANVSDYFPNTIGNITFTMQCSKATPNQLSIFPFEWSRIYLAGLPAFKFVADN